MDHSAEILSITISFSLLHSAEHSVNCEKFLRENLLSKSEEREQFLLSDEQIDKYVHNI